MKTRGSRLIACGVMAAAFVMNTSAVAATLFEQPLNIIGNPAGLNSSGPDSFATVPLLTSTQTADDFVLAQATILGYVSWFGQYYGTPVADTQPRDFIVRLFTNDASLPWRRPGTMIYEQRSAIAGIDTGRGTALGNRVLRYELDVAGAPLLSANTTYWLSILENDPGTEPIWRWSYGGRGIGRFGAEGEFAQRLSEFYPWNQIGPLIGRQTAFSLGDGNVPLHAPLPAPLAPMAVGLALVAAIRRRRT